MTRRLAEVAKYVGVSEATVSRVLNGKPGISEATRTSVLTALDVLGYERPTKLRGDRARLVGLVLPELQNPIFTAFAEVVAGALSQRGFVPVLCTRTEDSVSEHAYVEMLLEQQVSGAVFAGGLYAQGDAEHEHYRLLRERNLPVVLVNAAYKTMDFPIVSADDRVAVQQAYGHLDSLGHRKIGLLLGPADHAPSARKLAAFTELADVETADIEDRVTRSLYSMESAQAAATRLVKAGMTGLICASDVMALGAIRAVRRLGLTVPGDVSVVGHDDSPFMACTDPPLTTVRQPIGAMGQTAVALLVGQIDGGQVNRDEVFFDPELVVRGSTAVPSVASGKLR